MKNDGSLRSVDVYLLNVSGLNSRINPLNPVQIPIICICSRRIGYHQNTHDMSMLTTDLDQGTQVMCF